MHDGLLLVAPASTDLAVDLLASTRLADSREPAILSVVFMPTYIPFVFVVVQLPTQFHPMPILLLLNLPSPLLPILHGRQIPRLRHRNIQLLLSIHPQLNRLHQLINHSLLNLQLLRQTPIMFHHNWQLNNPIASRPQMRGHVQHHLQDDTQFLGVFLWDVRVEPTDYFLVESLHIVRTERRLQCYGLVDYTA